MALGNDDLSQLKARINKLEQLSLDQYLTLVEVMSNATFFGDLKKASCEYTNNGQCSFYVLKKEAQEKIPVATPCHIDNCPNQADHCHIEVSNVTCTLCSQWKSNGNLNSASSWLGFQQKSIE